VQFIDCCAANYKKKYQDIFIERKSHMLKITII
jgi:hypothetical protein